MPSHTLRLLCLASALTLTACASTPAQPCGPLGSSVCGGHAANIARDIAGWHNAHHADCRFVRPVSAQIVRDEGDAVVEHWTIEACEGRQFTCRTYLLPMGGGLTVMVSDVDAEDRAQ